MNNSSAILMGVYGAIVVGCGSPHDGGSPQLEDTSVEGAISASTDPFDESSCPLASSQSVKLLEGIVPPNTPAKDATAKPISEVIGWHLEVPYVASYRSRDCTASVCGAWVSAPGTATTVRLPVRSKTSLYSGGYPGDFFERLVEVPLSSMSGRLGLWLDTFTDWSTGKVKKRVGLQFLPRSGTVPMGFYEGTTKSSKLKYDFTQTENASAYSTNTFFKVDKTLPIVVGAHCVREVIRGSADLGGGRIAEGELVLVATF